jgi:uncharacterized protein YbjT (DUF2867 family)
MRNKPSANGKSFITDFVGLIVE